MEEESRKKFCRGHDSAAEFESLFSTGGRKELIRVKIRRLIEWKSSHIGENISIKMLNLISRTRLLECPVLLAKGAGLALLS